MNLKQIGLVLVLFAAVADAQPPDTLWTRTYGGPGFDSGNDILLLADGSSIVVGAYGSSPHDIGYVLHFDTVGDTLWTRTVSDSGLYQLWSVCLGHDSTIVFAGHSLWLPDGMIAGAIDREGSLLWLCRYPQFLYVNTAFDIKATGRSDYVIAGATVLDGSSFPNALLMRLDSSGTVIWYQLFGGVDHESLEAVVETADSGFAAAGSEILDNPDSMYFYLVRVDVNGDTLWTRVYDDDVNSWAHALAASESGDFLLAGDRHTGGGLQSDIKVIRVDAAGNLIWQRVYGGIGNEYGYDIINTEEEEYTICGYTSSYGAGQSDAYLIHINGNGDTLWTMTVGDAESQYAGQLGYVAPGAYAFVGSTTVQGNRQVWVARLGDPLGDGTDHPTFVVDPGLGISSYPNPFNAESRITFNIPRAGNVGIDLYNLTGQKVRNIANGHYSPGEHVVMLNGEGLASGIYFVRVEAGEMRAVKKIVLMK